ncbi:hypothetical protein CFD26_106792 [Aspergillus turcosus]|uniref:CID domain-containing protein n=1 Tax=Aspergillus turcosus TaxID=1245748 RepID=A0A3R7IHX7_9EURO|nr:hypothetical protein CFD26_106792 [Aspergillus turcosus]
MASHQVAIAKASFSAGLLRPDPTSVPRDEITAFHTLLDTALSHCSVANIQKCKTWLLNYVVSSSNRVGVWAKYLVALSSSFTSGENGQTSKPAESRPGTSSKRKRLHILYLLNDLFHHTKYHTDTPAAFSTLSGSLQPHIVELLGYAASYDRSKNPKHHRRLDDLLDIWDKNGYYGADYVNKLREVVKNSAVSGPVKSSIDVEQNNTDTINRPLEKNVPFVMPSTHGDSSTPYYDLPAGNLVPHIIPDSTVPLRPDTIKPLQFLAGPADEKLVTALKAFLKDVDRMYNSGQPEQKENEVVDVDEMGQTIIRDSSTGDILGGDTYYGWSRAFCQQMKERRAKGTRGGSRSRSPSRRRRYSGSSESDDSRWRSSSSRSRSAPRRREGHDRRYDSRSRSPRRSQSRERSYSPRAPSPPRYPPPEHHSPQYGNAGPQGFHPSHPPPPPPMHFPPGGNMPPGPPPFPPRMAPGALPPRPPNYQGQWPPPPPPPLPTMQFPPQGAGMNPSAFPPPFTAQGQFPPWNMASAQQMPPGSNHFPPPHPGGQGRDTSGQWNQYGGGYPPSGRGWR